MGRQLWATPDLTATERAAAQEHFFDEGSFPDVQASLDAAKQATKLDQERPAPFMGRTLPYAHMTMENYGKRINAWFNRVAQEEEPPTHEQLRVLWHVARRALQTF